MNKFIYSSIFYLLTTSTFSPAAEKQNQPASMATSPLFSTGVQNPPTKVSPAANKLMDKFMSCTPFWGSLSQRPDCDLNLAATGGLISNVGDDTLVDGSVNPEEYFKLNPDVKNAFESRPISDRSNKTQFAQKHYRAFSDTEIRARSLREFFDCHPDIQYAFFDPAVNTNIDEAKTDQYAFVAKYLAILVRGKKSPSEYKTVGCMNLYDYVSCYADVVQSCVKRSATEQGKFIYDSASYINVCALDHYNQFGNREGRTGKNNCNKSDNKGGFIPASQAVTATAPISPTTPTSPVPTATTKPEPVVESSTPPSNRDYKSFTGFSNQSNANNPSTFKNYRENYNPVTLAKVEGYLVEDTDRPGKKMYRLMSRNVDAQSGQSYLVPKVRIYLPPGTHTLHISSYTYYDDTTEQAVAWRFGTPPSTSYNNVCTHTCPHFENPQNYLKSLEAGYEWSYKVGTRVNILPTLTGGGAIQGVSQNMYKTSKGGWLYINMLKVTGGRVMSIDTVVGVDQQEYETWYKNAKWDTDGNPI